MKILPVINQYKTYNNSSLPCTKPVFGSSESDTFVKNTEGVFPLKEITSKTAQILYGMDYTPQSEPIKGYYLAHALDKETLKPVDIYIQKTFIDPTSGDVVKYLFYRRNPDGVLKLVGSRQFAFNDAIQKITPGYMESLDKSLMGIGFLEHQVAIEEMLKRGYKNVKIDAIQGAYDFHKKCGFESIDYYVYRPDHMLDRSVYYWTKRLNIKDERIIRKLLVFKPDSEILMLNANKTLENIVLYMKKNGVSIWEDVKVSMELSELALKEWKNIIKLKPILK